MLIYIKLQFNSHLFILRFSILVIQSLNILLPSVPYLFWFCQQFSCLILYCLTCTVSRFFSLTVQPLHKLNLVELFDLILLTRCTHFRTIFLLLDLFLFSVRYLGADVFFCLPCILVLPLPSLLHLLHYGCRYPWFSGNFPFKYPTFPSALFITTPFKFSHLSSVVSSLKHCTSSSISFLNNSICLSDCFCCFL